MADRRPRHAGLVLGRRRTPGVPRRGPSTRSSRVSRSHDAPAQMPDGTSARPIVRCAACRHRPPAILSPAICDLRKAEGGRRKTASCSLPVRRLPAQAPPPQPTHPYEPGPGAETGPSQGPPLGQTPTGAVPERARSETSRISRHVRGLKALSLIAACWRLGARGEHLNRGEARQRPRPNAGRRGRCSCVQVHRRQVAVTAQAHVCTADGSGPRVRG